MTDVSLCFEVHQPLRLKKNFFWEKSIFKRNIPGLLEFYFDDGENRRIFDRVSSKCYLPANRVILDCIRKFLHTERPFKVAYSLSGVFLEQCRRYNPQVLDSFIKLVDSGGVELMEQTYYHSLVSLFDSPAEFYEQVKMHRELIWDIFGTRPQTFENTELIYSDRIAELVAPLGYKAIFTEGVIADPNYVYKAQDQDLALLLRNYQLTDDIGFRFSSRWWEEYPLTADKYAAWLANTPGQCINLFCDYETFGEHQWEETGIFEFLRHLPQAVLKWDNLRFSTPAELARQYAPERELSVKEPVSWADLERDTSCWLGNSLQQACFLYLKQLEMPVKESQDRMLMEIWRLFGLSDHLYYMFTHGGGPGEVHSYFSPYGNPYDAAVTYFSVLADFHSRLKDELVLADQPFRFATGVDEFTGQEAWSLAGLLRIMPDVEASSLEYHTRRGDLTSWARFSLRREELADRISKLSSLKGEALREGLLRAAASALEER
ncbi:MAG: alpha-amylase [Methanotrichaceae archaeon]|nr:alpha-amylase [Methanotrichaceae archaeon]